MRVLVTGGTGVVGRGAVTALVERGHRVRLLSRHASEDAAEWPQGVEAHDGTITDPASLRGGADGCDAVLHLAGIVRESPPDQTFQAVNVEGTRHVVDEAARAGVRRFVYVSSLGADRGQSDYHRSKLAGEGVARTFPREWVVLRPGNVYGPGDEVISLLLKLIRVLPVLPLIDGGDHEFQPVWVGDAAEVLARSVDQEGLAGQALDFTGPDRTCMRDLVQRLRTITGRSPIGVPVPGAVVALGAKLGEALGFHLPVTAGQIQMLEEGSRIDDPAANALDAVFHVRGTGLEEGLKRLADALPEQTPAEGKGALVHRHVWADIQGSSYSAEELFARFRRRFADITPWHVEVGAEPGTGVELHAGETLTMHLVGLGNVQVRVDELTPRTITLVTLEGHPLAGAVHFVCDPLADRKLRFAARVYDRAANLADLVIMRAVGDTVQRFTWEDVVKTVVEESGGRAVDGVHHASETLHGEAADAVEAWIRHLVTQRLRDTHARGESAPDSQRESSAR